MALFSNHHTREVQLTAKTRKRTIGNFINYKTPGGLWVPAVNGVITAPGTPPNWSGQFDFQYQNITSALQFFSHDTTDPDNRTLVGMRLDGTPDIWINYKAYNLDNLGVSTVVSGDESSWENIWTNSTLKWAHGVHSVKKEIILSAVGHPSSFSFTVKNSPGSSLVISNDIIQVKDAQGSVRFLTREPYGWDANGNYIRCTLTQTDSWGPGGMYPIVTITPNADDMAGATYPITIDPTTTIDHTGIEDTELRESEANNNYGATVGITLRRTDPTIDNRGWFRLDESLIPEGTLTALDFNFHVLFVNTAGTMEVFKVAAANADMIEGTANDTTQAGSPCWNYKAYDASTPTNWAGSAGMSTSGTDYESDASPPSFTSTSSQAETLNLGAKGAGWCDDWAATPSNNGGFICITDGSTQEWGITSVDNATVANRPSFDITYEAAAAVFFLSLPNGNRLI